MSELTITETLAIPKMGKLQMVGMMLIWFIFGLFGGPIIFVVVPISIFFLGHKRMHIGLLLGFFFVLILAANRLNTLGVFEMLRIIYLLFLGAFIVFDSTLRPIDNIYKAFIPFFLIALFWLINSNTVITSFATVVSYFLILFTVPIYLNRIYEYYSDVALEYIVYFGIFILSVGFIFGILGSNIAFLSGRYRGIFGNPNGLGIFTMLFFFLVVVINTYKPFLFSKRKKILFYCVIIITLLLCRSRTALGAVVLFLFFWYFYRISKAIGVLILIGVIISSHLLYANLPEIITFLDLGAYLRVETLQSASGRLIAYQFAWEHIKQNIWIGGGMGYAENLYRTYQFILNPLGHQGGTHNVYLTIWLETGLIGLIFFVGGWLMNFWRASKQSYLAYPILLAVAFSSFFETWLSSSINAFTIMLIMIITLLTNRKFIGNYYE